MKVYAFKNFKNIRSSSGGAFPEIVDAYYKEVGEKLVVFGAAFNDDFSVSHCGKRFSDGIDCFKESKYVRSDISNSLQQISELLSKGTPVLFSGTPCQVEAIMNVLSEKNINADNLLTVDLICHGTPKSELWADFVELIRNKYGRIKRVCFRNNELRKKGKTFIELEDGRMLYDVKEMRTYMRLFSTNLSLYKGCFECKYRKKELKRPADLTIGDFWGVQNIIREFKNVNNVSLLLPNTEKGNYILNIIQNSTSEKSLIYECKDERWKVYNPHLFEKTPIPRNYDDFWKEYNSLPFEAFNDKYCKAKLRYIIKRRLSEFLGKIGLKYKIKSVFAYLKK